MYPPISWMSPTGESSSPWISASTASRSSPTRPATRSFRTCSSVGVGTPTLEQVLKERVAGLRSEEHTSELQSHSDLVCRLLLEKKKKKDTRHKSFYLSHN